MAYGLLHVQENFSCHLVGFEVFVVLIMKSLIFWNVMLCTLSKVNQHLAEHLQEWSVGKKPASRILSSLFQFNELTKYKTKCLPPCCTKVKWIFKKNEWKPICVIVICCVVMNCMFKSSINLITNPNTICSQSCDKMYIWFVTVLFRIDHFLYQTCIFNQQS
jgi:hypothetical protein